MQLSVVIPVRNEADNIAPLVGEIGAALEGVCDYEIIYVDDGSSDATWPQLCALRSTVPRLRLLRHQRNCGQSAALLTGVRAARAPWIATLDGDGQNDPADIAGLLQIAAQHSAAEQLLIIGNRIQRRDSRWRRFTSRVANGVRSRLLGDATPDTGCGLKLLPRQLFLSLPYFDHMHRFLPALVQRCGGVSLSTPVHHRPRRRGRSKYGTLDRLWAGIIDMLGVIWLQRRGSLPVIVEEQGEHTP
jgi:dolichol-phosphate mannosyltransferase